LEEKGIRANSSWLLVKSETVSVVSESSKAFEAHIGPLRRALIALIDEGDALRKRWGSIPNPESRAMAEIASESQYEGAGPWGNEPVRQAHNLGQLLLVGANDTVRAACKLLEDDETPVFAHIVLARSALEHAGRAWWLLSPGASLRQRIARGYNERLYSLAEQSRLPVDLETKKRAHARISGILDEAERVGFRKVPAKRGRPSSLQETRPSSTELTRRLLKRGSDDELGKVVYSYFSAVAHGTTFGLAQSVGRDPANAPPSLGITWGAIFTSSQAVCSVLAGLVLGMERALGARNELFAWDSLEWKKAVLAALRAARTGLGFEK
jgi:hypothetical protein